MLCGASWSASAQETVKSGLKQRGERDPFGVYHPPPPKRKAVKPVPVVVTPPTIQERIDRYKAQKVQAMSMQQPAPKPTTALLLSEMQVIGIFRTPRGYAAMVEATPIKLSYVVYPGEQFYDGQLVAIEENRLVFRQETRYTDGKSQLNVETKPLRQANAVSDSMAATRSAADEKATPANGTVSTAPSSEKQ